MPIIVSEKAGTHFEPVSEGVHIATCVSLVDIGVQHNEMYGKDQKKVILTWEFPDDIIETENGERPKTLSKEYTASLGEKATLRGHLEAWRGKKFTSEELKGFDMKNILGTSCQIQVTHISRNGNTYANVQSIMALPKGAKVAPSMSQVENGLTYFALDEPDCLEKMGDLPNWIQEKIRNSVTYQEMESSQKDPISGDFGGYSDDEDLPF